MLVINGNELVNELLINYQFFHASDNKYQCFIEAINFVSTRFTTRKTESDMQATIVEHARQKLFIIENGCGGGVDTRGYRSGHSPTCIIEPEFDIELRLNADTDYSARLSINITQPSWSPQVIKNKIRFSMDLTIR